MAYMDPMGYTNMGFDLILRKLNEHWTAHLRIWPANAAIIRFNIIKESWCPINVIEITACTRAYGLVIQCYTYT